MKKVVIAGAGPAGLMAAHFLSGHKNLQVQLYDAGKAPARKFLVAGHGGFNLTNSQELPVFIEKYNHSFIRNSVTRFTNQDTVKWLSEIGIDTFVGTSGKVFPKKGIKPIQVLTAWLDFLKMNGVVVETGHRLVDFDGKTAVFQSGERSVNTDYDFLVFAMGGASWKKTGSIGAWTHLFGNKNIGIIPFEASNAGIALRNWDEKLGGGILKNTEISINGKKEFGEIELTDYGVEGAPVYALSNEVRKGCTDLFLNLKPAWSREVLNGKFRQFKGTKTEFLREIKLSKSAIDVLKRNLAKEDFIRDDEFLNAIGQLKLSIRSLQPVDEAISTVGGVSMDEIDENFQLMKYRNHYCIGEMLDWDAPTGGYLLQACFASGHTVSDSIIRNL